MACAAGLLLVQMCRIDLVRQSSRDAAALLEWDRFVDFLTGSTEPLDRIVDDGSDYLWQDGINAIALSRQYSLVIGTNIATEVNN